MTLSSGSLDNLQHHAPVALLRPLSCTGTLRPQPPLVPTQATLCPPLPRPLVAVLAQALSLWGSSILRRAQLQWFQLAISSQAAASVGGSPPGPRSTPPRRLRYGRPPPRPVRPRPNLLCRGASCPTSYVRGDSVERSLTVSHARSPVHFARALALKLRPLVSAPLSRFHPYKDARPASEWAPKQSAGIAIEKLLKPFADDLLGLRREPSDGAYVLGGPTNLCCSRASSNTDPTHLQALPA